MESVPLAGPVSPAQRDHVHTELADGYGIDIILPPSDQVIVHSIHATHGSYGLHDVGTGRIVLDPDHGTPLIYAHELLHYTQTRRTVGALDTDARDMLALLDDALNHPVYSMKYIRRAASRCMSMQMLLDHDTYTHDELVHPFRDRYEASEQLPLLTDGEVYATFLSLHQGVRAQTNGPVTGDALQAVLHGDTAAFPELVETFYSHFPDDLTAADKLHISEHQAATGQPPAKIITDLDDLRERDSTSQDRIEQVITTYEQRRITTDQSGTNIAGTLINEHLDDYATTRNQQHATATADR